MTARNRLLEAKNADLTPMADPVTRLAPSPTGALHLGNARTFLINWALARQSGWMIQMRIEDLDGPRIKSGAIDGTLDILAWLDIDWDGEPTIQSDDLEPYRRVMFKLAAGHMIFSCDLSRRDIEEAASAPHGSVHESCYPRSLRPPPSESERWEFVTTDTNYRFTVPDGSVDFTDEIAGAVHSVPAKEIGDFVVWTRRGTPAYQLAVVVDDARQGVTDVVRGDDLLSSTSRQLLLYRALAFTPPRWWHLPLVIGPDGRRLAKRHGDTRISTYRDEGVPAEAIIGLIASWSGTIPEPRLMTAPEFRDTLEIARLPRSPVTFTRNDHEWLLSAGH